MSASLLQPPPRIAYSRRAVPMLLKTDRIDPARRATIVLTFQNENTQEGEKITLKWLGNTVVFTFKTTPNSSGIELPTFDHNRFFDDYLTDVARLIRQHFLIADDFNVYQQPNTIRLVAKSTAPMELTVNATLQSATVTASSPISVALDTNLSAYARVIDGTETPIGAPFNVPYDLETSEAAFDLQSVFSHLQPHLPLPESLDPLSNYHFEIGYQSFMSYRVRFSDKSGAPPTPQLAAVSDEYFALYGTAETFPTTSTIAVECHATPTIRKQVSAAQPDYLYLWSLLDLPYCFVELTVYLDNGRVAIYLPNNGTRFFLGRDTLPFFRTGFTQLGLDSINIANGRRIVAYDFRIIHDNSLFLNATSPRTEIAVRRYDVDYHAADKDLYLLFDNGLGGMETLRLRGSMREKYTVEMTETEGFDGEKTTYGEEITATYDITTDVMPTNAARHYRQLLRGKLWLCDVKNKQFKKVVRITKDIEFNPKIPFNALKFAIAIAKKEI